SAVCRDPYGAGASSRAAAGSWQAPIPGGPDRRADAGLVPTRLPELPFGEYTIAMVQPHSTRVMGDWKGCRRGSPSGQLLQMGFLLPGGTGGVSHPDRQCSAHWPDAFAALYVAPSRSSCRLTGEPANLRMEQSGEKTPARGRAQDLVVCYRRTLRPVVTHPTAAHPALRGGPHERSENTAAF